MKDYILYQQHIMWYESKMLTETLNSIQNALHQSILPVKFKFCLNSQTYIENPINGSSSDMFNDFINHEIMQYNTTEIIYKNQSDEFYNIADFRRDVYDKNAKYTVWGESDCLLPYDFFYILSNIHISSPHILSLASRKMWDDTWNEVEHVYVREYPRYKNSLFNAPKPYNSSDVITQKDLDELNNKYDYTEIVKLKNHKIDGSLLCISGGITEKFIPEKMHFVREDTCAEKFFEKKNIAQYHMTNVMKGHNYTHPLKRTNTNNTRNDDLFIKYKNESETAMFEFLNML